MGNFRKDSPIQILQHVLQYFNTSLSSSTIYIKLINFSPIHLLRSTFQTTILHDPTITRMNYLNNPSKHR